MSVLDIFGHQLSERKTCRAELSMQAGLLLKLKLGAFSYSWKCTYIIYHIFFFVFGKFIQVIIPLHYTLLAPGKLSGFMY